MLRETVTVSNLAYVINYKKQISVQNMWNRINQLTVRLGAQLIVTQFDHSVQKRAITFPQSIYVKSDQTTRDQIPICEYFYDVFPETSFLSQEAK